MGTTRGTNPEVSEERLGYFPFLRRTRLPTRIRDLENNYETAFESLIVVDKGNEQLCNCMFLGSETDVFHFALYY